MTYHPPTTDSPKPSNSCDHTDNSLLQTPLLPSTQKSPIFSGPINAEIEPHNAVMTIAPMPDFPTQSTTLNNPAHTVITIHPEQPSQQTPIDRSNQSTPKQSYPVYSDQVEDEPGLRTGYHKSADAEGSAELLQQIGGTSNTSTEQKADVHTYIASTELTDGQHALLIDPGSVNNLTGGEWVRRGASLAIAAGKRGGIQATKRNEPLRVSGVGTNPQECHYNTTLPLSLRDIHGNTIECTYTAPTINSSTLPALLGLNTLIKMGGIMDFRNMQLHFTGPGPCNYTSHLPEGTSTFEMKQAPSGHVMLPCCKYPAKSETSKQSQEEGTLTLHATSQATSSTETPSNPVANEATLTTSHLRNVWNVFQERYKGQGLTQPEFSSFYHWPQRSELEKHYNDRDVVQQFLAQHRDDYTLIPGGNATPNH